MARAAVAVRTGRLLHSCCGGVPSGVVEGKLAYDVYGDRWSRFTFLIYLNDDFDGGATTFYTPSERLQIAPPDAPHACNSLALHLAAHDARRAPDASAQERTHAHGSC
jgi:hypothetical protein